MRTILTALVFLAACSGVAQSETRYDLYIFQPRDDGPSTYAFSGGNNAVALEVRGCGDVRLLPNAPAVASDLSARRGGSETSVVTIAGRGSRTYLGPCAGDEDEDEEAAEDEGDRRDSLVVIEDVSAREMRRLIRSLDAAPSDVRQEIIATLGLS